MSRRWICPKCRKGVNAPERLKRNDSRRYCLKCSGKSLTLVERECPAIEAAKVKRVEVRKAKTVKRRERHAAKASAAKAADDAAPFRDSNSKIYAEFYRLRNLNAWGRRLNPHFTIRRSRVRSHRVSGHCWGSNRIVITIGYEDDAAAIKEVILHELAHAASRCREHHNDLFRSLNLDAAREAYGVGKVEAHSQIWKFGQAIAAAIRETERKTCPKGINPPWTKRLQRST